jgi:phage terminase Nu1 subunit (DNA packaging protein)
LNTRRLILDLDQVAAIFCVSEKCVRDWANAGMPVAQAGSRGGRRIKTQLDLFQVVRWYFKENHERRELDRTRARLNRAMSELAELKAAASRGDLVSLRGIGREFGKLLAEVRTNALAIPAKLAPELEGRTASQCYVTVEHAVHELLDHCAGWRPGGSR